MTIKQISTKIELTFWHHFINLLTDYSFFQEAIRWVYHNYLYPKNRNTQQLYWRITGITAGLTLIVVATITFLISTAPHKTSQQNYSHIDIPTNGQRNILIIGVDDLSKENPDLVGIWLLMYFPEKPKLSFASIYPNIWNQTQLSTSHTADLHPVIKNGSINKKLLNKLHQDNIWWHGYVLLDSTAVKKAVNFYNRANDQDSISTTNPVNDPYLSGEPSLTGIGVQTGILKHFCQRTKYLTADTDISNILALIPAHIRTDMNLITIIQDWKSLISQEHDLVCEFPLQRASIP